MPTRAFNICSPGRESSTHLLGISRISPPVCLWLSRRSRELSEGSLHEAVCDRHTNRCHLVLQGPCSALSTLRAQTVTTAVLSYIILKYVAVDASVGNHSKAGHYMSSNFLPLGAFSSVPVHTPHLMQDDTHAQHGPARTTSPTDWPVTKEQARHKKQVDKATKDLCKQQAKEVQLQHDFDTTSAEHVEEKGRLAAMQSFDVRDVEDETHQEKRCHDAAARLKGLKRRRAECEMEVRRMREIITRNQAYL